MKPWLSIIIAVSLLSACGIKRELVLPCHDKYRHPTADNGTESAKPADAEPCVSTQVNANGQVITNPTPAAPATTGAGQR